MSKQRECRVQTLCALGKTWRKPALIAICILSGFGFVRTATGQAVRLQPAQIRPRPDLICVACSLSVSASPATVSLTLVRGGRTAASAPIVITTTLTGVSGLGTLKLFGYFSSSARALTDSATPANDIPSSAVLGLMTTGAPTTYTAFTGSGALGTSGADLLLFSTSSLLSVGCIPLTASCRTDSLFLKIDLSGVPQLPAGTYTGTLSLQAQAL